MIYAIILIALGLLMLLLNKKEMSVEAAKARAWVSIPLLIWGTVGMVILSTMRFGVFHEKPTYWIFLMLGCLLEIVLGGFLIYRYVASKKEASPEISKLSIYHFELAISAVVLGAATLLVL